MCMCCSGTLNICSLFQEIQSDETEFKPHIKILLEKKMTFSNLTKNYLLTESRFIAGRPTNQKASFFAGSNEYYRSQWILFWLSNYRTNTSKHFFLAYHMLMMMMLKDFLMDKAFQKCQILSSCSSFILCTACIIHRGAEAHCTVVAFDIGWDKNHGELRQLAEVYHKKTSWGARGREFISSSSIILNPNTSSCVSFYSTSAK